MRQRRIRNRNITGYFNPRIPEWDATGGTENAVKVFQNFNPRIPEWDATLKDTYEASVRAISIHASLSGMRH